MSLKRPAGYLRGAARCNSQSSWAEGAVEYRLGLQTDLFSATTRGACCEFIWSGNDRDAGAAASSHKRSEQDLFIVTLEAADPKAVVTEEPPAKEQAGKT